MSHSQLMQLIGPAGLGGLGNVCGPGPSAAAWGCALAFGLFPVSRYLALSGVTVPRATPQSPQWGPSCPLPGGIAGQGGGLRT